MKITLCFMYVAVVWNEFTFLKKFSSFIFCVRVGGMVGLPEGGAKLKRFQTKTAA